MAKSNTKGKRGEYEVRDILQKKFYPNGDGQVVRTPMSGAWGGMPVLTGDLIFLKNGEPDVRFPFFWEVKLQKRSALAPFRILGGTFPTLKGWLEKATVSGTSSRIPLVVWRTDFSPWFVFMWETDFRVLSEWFGPTSKQMTELRSGGCVNLIFAEWLEWVKLECFIHE